MRLTKLVCSLLVLFLFSGQSFSQYDDVYAKRRVELLKEIDGGVIILSSYTSADRLNKDFYYLTGIDEPGATLFIISEGNINQILFNRNGNWSYADKSSKSEVYKSEEINRYLNRFISGQQELYVSFKNIGIVSELGRGLSGVESIKNIDPFIVRMRIYKDETEIDILKKACLITAQGLNDTYKAIEPGLKEKDLKTFMEYGFERRESPGISFLQAASGPNSTNIHFGAGERILENGDMIVFDVGAYWDKYTADISRSVPVSGKFNREQKEIYQLVLNAQKAAIEHMVPGQKIMHVHKIAEDVLIDGLFKLGLVLDKSKESSFWYMALTILSGWMCMMFGMIINMMKILNMSPVW
ncbi:M24 family metallopeptidase [Bacteroidota bacterium]